MHALYREDSEYCGDLALSGRRVDGPVTAPYGVNGLNQYTLIDGLAAPVYDTKGNLTRIQHPAASVASPAGAIWNYTYDAQNRLIGGTR